MNSDATLLHIRLRTLAFAAGIVGIFVSVAVLIGWGANVPWLTNLSPRFVTMKPFAAVCFLLSGVSLCLLASRSASWRLALQPLSRKPASLGFWR